MYLLIWNIVAHWNLQDPILFTNFHNFGTIHSTIQQQWINLLNFINILNVWNYVFIQLIFCALQLCASSFTLIYMGFIFSSFICDLTLLDIKIFMNDWSSWKTFINRLNMLIPSKESYTSSIIGLRHYNIEIVMFWQEIFEK